MRNAPLPEHVRTRINARVDRLLRELGRPPPPLRLEDVRELLSLDRDYFSGDDDSLARQTISHMKIAGKQFFLRPGLLLDAVRKFDLRALYLPDRKRILIDKTVPEKKHRWLEAHEIGHGILPWHSSMMFGDDDHTPTPACHEKLENEASYAGGQLLFLRDQFVSDARSLPATFASIKKLHTTYGNTITTTLWRYIEQINPALPIVGIISGHPHPACRGEKFNPDAPCRYFIQSPGFAAQFANVAEAALFAEITGYCGRQSGGRLGGDELTLTDDNGDEHLFLFETFFNRYEALTLGIHLRKVAVAVSF